MRQLLRLGRFMRPFLGQMVMASLLLAFAGALMSLAVAAMKPMADLVLFPSPETVAGDAPADRSGLMATLHGWIPITAWGDWLAAHEFVAVPLLLIVIFSVRGLALYVGRYMTAKVGSTIIRNIRADLNRVISSQSISFFKDHSSGELVSRMFGDVQRLQRLSTDVLADLVRVGTMIPFMLVVVFIHDWRVSLFTLVVFPLVAYPVTRLGRRLRRAATRSQESMAQATTLFGETARGMMVVQSFGMERFMGSRFGQALDRMLKADLQAARAGALSGPIMEQIGALSGALLFYLAGMGIAMGRVEPGDFVVVVGGLGFLFASVRRLTNINVEVQQGMSAANRVFALMDLTPAIRDRPGAETLEGFGEAVRFESVVFHYGGEDILKGISTTIRRGERVALVGPSGAGKTTLANLLPRFYDPADGRITIDGHDLRDLTLTSLRSAIGIVTQETLLFDGTVRENIAFGRVDVPHEKILEAARAARVDEFIAGNPKGYEAMVGESGCRFSMGQRQRLAIARALLKDPPILILDEATSSLDAESEHLVQEALETLLEGRTSLIIAHRLATIQSADRILVMEAGRIVEEGSHADLLAAGGLYARLHALQFRNGATPATAH
jgi:subfamily B ATP-binding cassette protein MsbA